jgi:cytochrome c oxidase subunit 2
MESTIRASVIVLAGALFAASTTAVPLAAAKPHAAIPIVNVVATADQKFAPDHVVLHVGKPQTLRFTSTGGVHGIASEALGIPSTMILPDKPVSISVTPKKAGTYKVPCAIVCGAGHADMALTVEVKP